MAVALSIKEEYPSTQSRFRTWFEPGIDRHAGVLPLTFGNIAICVFFGIPAGLALWLVCRILRFAIGSPAILRR